MPSWTPDWRTPSDYKHKIIDYVGRTPGRKDLIHRSHVCLESLGVLGCLGYQYDTISTTSRTAQEVEPSSGSIGKSIWDTKWQKRKMLEHGVLSDPRTKLGTVTNLFARSHPLTYHRKLATTRGGILCLVPKDAREGDLICQLVGSEVPYILRRLERKDLEVRSASIWERLRDRVLDWITWTTPRSIDFEDLNAEILESLRRKNMDVGKPEIQHCIFIGEAFVDGLMQRGLAVPSKSENVKERFLFALH